MLGSARLRRLAQPITVALEDQAPAGNVYCHLEVTRDSRFVWNGTRDLAAERDRPNVNPIAVFPS